MAANPRSALADDLRAQMAADEAARLEAEAQIAQIRADEARDTAERARKQGTATAPGR